MFSTGILIFGIILVTLKLYASTHMSQVFAALAEPLVDQLDTIPDINLRQVTRPKVYLHPKDVSLIMDARTNTNLAPKTVYFAVHSNTPLQ